MDREGKKLEQAIHSAWCMFEQTGNVGYYLLYKRLGGKKERR